MPIFGSFAKTAQKQLRLIPEMLRETASESLDVIEQLTKDGTPVDTGELRESIHQTPIEKVGDRIKGTVTSDNDHAAPIEYGSSGHAIFPNDAKALKFHDGTYKAYALHHPGHRGYHMFRHAAITFERINARVIAEKNAKKYLGSS